MLKGATGVGAPIIAIPVLSLSGATLSSLVAAVLLAYIVFRLLRPDWQLAYVQALPYAAPAGFFAGVLQGASGISAPISITFLNAMYLERITFGTWLAQRISRTVFDRTILALLGAIAAKLLYEVLG